ncbi:hypothetical protein [Bacillus kwashiorkori]|uniref:hypothetical protein n=1 Tax=Bacillus kwashiorkori TaxID=1522318 RepID=UPI00078207ED|nr:hypothetical protein [Bacillus kwashiorkori]
MVLTFILVAGFILFYMNNLMHAFCIQKEIPDEKQPSVIRTVNILTLILLISSYIEILFT